MAQPPAVSRASAPRFVGQIDLWRAEDLRGFFSAIAPPQRAQLTSVPAQLTSVPLRRARPGRTDPRTERRA
ncbi:hypothetical protein [Nannocystis pusilla]|uniref:hypothetical protein n=1 Tax=Nannocystis pusilla TaxID=889268 RepID=UPI003DA36579